MKIPLAMRPYTRLIGKGTTLPGTNDKLYLYYLPSGLLLGTLNDSIFLFRADPMKQLPVSFEVDSHQFAVTKLESALYLSYKIKDGSGMTRIGV